MEFIRMARKKGELSPTMKVVKKIKGVYAKKQRKGWDDKNWKGKLFSKTEKESKCPVSFLFRKKKSSNKGFK